MQAAPEKRIPKDGVAYTLEEFREYYGVRGTALFSECPSAEESQPEQPHAVAASSEYADSSVLQPAAEHTTLIGSIEDMLAPLQKDQARKLSEVIDHITDDMNWARLKEISASSRVDATFADIDWVSTLSNVWQEASQNTQRCFTTRWSLED